MPTKTSFKVACPSCEAMIPVRDSALIGKKIDCPKCKYRFLVEEPDGEGIDGGAEPVQKFKSKKKAGSKNVLLLGSILGGVALLLLGVGAYVLFKGDDPKPSPAPAPMTLTKSAPSDPTASPDAVKAADGTPATPAGTPANADGLAAGAPTEIPFNDISNLLPGDAQSVLALHVDRLRACKLGYIAFESRSGFRPETFRQKLGVPIDDITRLVRAENIDSNWTFNVLTMSRPVTLDELKVPLGLERASKSPIQGREYYTISPNDLLDNLATILQSELETRTPTTTNPTGDESSKRVKSGPLTLLQVNPTTFVIATLEPMEEFLQAGAKWEWKSRPAPGSDDPSAAASAGTESSGQGDAGAVTINKNRQAGGSAGGTTGSGPQFTNRRTFLCVEPSLKVMMDRLEGDGAKIIGSMSQRLQSNARIVDRIRESTGLRQLEVRGMNVMGAALYEFDPSRFRAEAIVETFREADAKVYEDAVKALLTAAAQVMSVYLGGIRIDVEGGGSSGGGGGGTSGPGGSGGAGSESVGAPPPPDAAGGRPAGSGDAGAGPNDGPKSTLSFSRSGRLLRLGTELNMTIKAYDKVYELAQNLVIRARGMVDMASPTPHWHELGTAGVTVRKDGVLPRGTFVREDSLGGRVSRNFPPHQRVSWLTSLLPFMGHEDIFAGIDKKKSWRDEENMKYGAILVPEFLNPKFPRSSWRASVPSLGIRDQGGTHVVGVAGVGADAADYSFNDPAVAKKIGMVGYDRRANVKDVTDGMSNTIFMIQVPPTNPRPWIAGGGATITGIPEKDSVRPFVVSGSSGKRGATVIMGDGSVRFINEMVSDDVFKALGTIRGGEEIVDLDKQAPKVDPPKKGELRTASAGSGTGDNAKPQSPAGELK